MKLEELQNGKFYLYGSSSNALCILLISKPSFIIVKNLDGHNRKTGHKFLLNKYIAGFCHLLTDLEKLKYL